jgi:hypothetical protein
MIISNSIYMIIDVLSKVLIKDLSYICLSYLSEDEQIYIKKEWHKFKKYSVCSTAANNGHLYIFILNEVLKWARQNGCDWDSWTCSYAAENGIV